MPGTEAPRTHFGYSSLGLHGLRYTFGLIRYDPQVKSIHFSLGSAERIQNIKELGNGGIHI